MSRIQIDSHHYSHTQHLQREKMAAIGRLAAGIAHEINNPNAFVRSNLFTLIDYHKSLSKIINSYQELAASISSDQSKNQLSPELKKKLHWIERAQSEMDLEFLLAELKDLVEDCFEGTSRISKIVSDLSKFHCLGEEAMGLVDIVGSIELALSLIQDELKDSVRVTRDFGQMPPVICKSQQISQVFMIFLVNAAQAIQKEGEVKITTRANSRHVAIDIADNGIGIPDENIGRIFDPFFTTKDVGEGTGLGLYIAYNTIKAHGGQIEVYSVINQGTTFTIHLPIGDESGISH